MAVRRATRAASVPAEARLVALFREHGYQRVPDTSRRKTGTATYKKGYEIRWVTDSRQELLAVRKLLHEVGFKPGKAFKKHEQWVQPVYGRLAMEEFHKWLRRYGRRSRPK